jgi:hypothetical protein
VRKLLAPLALALVSLPAKSQSINVDFEPARNPYGALTVYHAGAAIDPGFWNSVSATTVRSLRESSGAVTGVALTATHTGSFLEASVVSSAGELDRVFNDYWRGSTDSMGYGYASWEFRGLAAGEYEIYTICGSPTHGDGLTVSVEGSPNGVHHVYADAGPYQLAVNFTRHRKIVTDGRIEVFASNGGFAPSAPAISAIQIVRLPDPGEFLCTGDGYVATCRAGTSATPVGLPELHEHGRGVPPVLRHDESRHDCHPRDARAAERAHGVRAGHHRGAPRALR